MSDAIRNAAMRFGAALDLWKKHTPPERVAAQSSPAVEKQQGNASSRVAAPAGGDPTDAFLDVLMQPHEWWDNRLDKRNPKAPDFKAKNTNKNWAKSGVDQNGNPGPEALWLRDAPAPFEEALAAGATEYSSVSSGYAVGNTVAEAVSNLDAVIVEDDEPF